MDFEEEVALIYLVYRRYKMRQRRRFWVAPLLSSRLLRGPFHTVFEKLVTDEKKFADFFRMSPTSFDELLYTLKKQLKRKDTNMRLSISPEERLGVTLRYLGSGRSFSDLHYTFKIGLSTIRNIVKEVCHLIWEMLREQVLPRPSTEKWREIAAGTLKYANFPNCLGALSSKFARVMRDDDGAICYKYKNCACIVLFATTDCSYNFTYADVCFYNQDYTYALFKETSLYNDIVNRTLSIPDHEPFPNTYGPPMPFAFTASEGFGLSDNIFRPFGKIHAKKFAHKQIFNCRLSRVQRFAESTFAILTNKWQIFHKPFAVNLDFAIEIAKACIVLHNFVIQRDGYSFEDTLVIEGLEDDSSCQMTHSTKSAISNRDMFAEYLVSENGALPGKDKRIV